MRLSTRLRALPQIVFKQYRRLSGRAGVNHKPMLELLCDSTVNEASGIVSFQWTINRPPDGLTFEAFYLDRFAKIPRPEVETKRSFSIHTHLVPDGTANIGIRAKDEAGMTVAQTTIAICVHNEGWLADAVRQSLRSHGTPLFIVDPCDSSLYPYHDERLWPWFDPPDALDTIAKWSEAGEIDDVDALHLRDFVQKGFIIVPGLVAPELSDRINSELDDLVVKGYRNYEYGTSQRIEHLHEHYKAIRELWLHPEVMRLLRMLFQSLPRPCQTLTYMFGSEQDPHQDTIHLTPFPAGYMCGVWVALQDVEPGSGELEVYVGSHRLPRTRMDQSGLPKVSGDWTQFAGTIIAEWKRMIEIGQFERLVYRPKKGTVLIWHENLMHGGAVRRDPSLPRRSIVSHVFANGALSYYDSTGLVGHMAPLAMLRAEAPETFLQQPLSKPTLR